MKANWSGHHSFQATQLHHPTNVSEIQAIVRAATRCRVVGSGHSFNDIADTTIDLIALDLYTFTPIIDDQHGTVTVPGSMRYGDLLTFLAPTKWALHNTASLPHISVAGTIATATHGSGVHNKNLATAVIALEFVRADGERVRVSADSHGEQFNGMVVHLGALGVVTSVTLKIVPRFDMRQDVYLGLPYATAMAHFDEIMSASYSVSLFTTWQGDTIEQVWRKSLPHEIAESHATWYGATAAQRPMHPIASMNADPCTTQMGMVGGWHERLPHFRMEFTPSNGDELQTEYFVDRRDAVLAMQAIRTIQDRIAPVLFISEIRTVAADQLWLSMNYERESVALHFTWKNRWPEVQHVISQVEAVLAPFAPRAHWGKLFNLPATHIRSVYPRIYDFLDLRAQWDPQGKFVNHWMQHTFCVQ